MYCDRFNLRQYIKFNRKVVTVTPEIGPDGEHTGRWEVVTQRVRRKQPTTPPAQPAPRRSARSPAPPPSDTLVPSAVDGRRAFSPERGRSPAPDSQTNGRGRMYSPMREYDPAAEYEPVPRSESESPKETSFMEITPPSPSLSDRSSQNQRERPFSPIRRKRRDKSRSSSEHPVKSKCETFDYVIVATGHHWKPRLPDFKGIETFKGGMLHSHSYKV